MDYKAYFAPKCSNGATPGVLAWNSNSHRGWGNLSGGAEEPELLGHHECRRNLQPLLHGKRTGMFYDRTCSAMS